MEAEGVRTVKDTKAELDYLKELLTDRSILSSDPRAYIHVDRILEREILRIRSALFASYGINTISENELPEPEGHKVNLQAKVYMPNDASNSFNFVGRILGPDGSTAKCLQQCLGVKIMVRGRGSMRDRRKEEANMGKPNWEHLNDRLHVVLTVEDYENRAKARLAKASKYITMFLKESMKGSDKEDKVKQMQLMELSFRRESCHSWSLNCNNNILNVNIPQKSDTLFSEPSNFINFGYGYLSSPLFSSIHHNSIPSLHPYGTLSQPASAHISRPPQAPSQPTPISTLGGVNQPLTGFSNLNTATFLVGHNPNGVSSYANPYCPNSHNPSTPSLPASLTGLTPINYWSGQGLSHMPQPDYAFAHTHLQLPQNTNTMSPSDDALVPTMCGSTGHVASVTQPSLYLSHHPLSRAVTDDILPQYIFTDFNACSLDPVIDTHGTSLTLISPESYSSKPIQHVSVNKRYTEKHYPHIVTDNNNATTVESCDNRRQPTNRTAVVTLRIHSNEFDSPLSSSSPTLNGTETSTTFNNLVETHANVDTVDIQSAMRMNSKSEVDWPKLGSQDVMNNTSIATTPSVQSTNDCKPRTNLT